MVILITITWSPVALQPFQTMDQCKLQTQQLEKVTMRFTILHLKIGNIDSAYDEFKALESQEYLVEEIVKSLYANNTLEVLQIFNFICKFNRSASSYKAINTLYEEMAKNNQLEQKEIIPMYFKIQSAYNSSDRNIKPQFSILQKQYQALNSKLSTLKVKIVNSIVNNIKNRRFERLNDMINITQSLSLQDAMLFQADVVKQYLTVTNTTQFANLLNFVQVSNSFTTICNFYAAIWKELETSGALETMEALAVWTHASEIVDTRQIQDTLCSAISAVRAPAYRQMLVYRYTDYIKNGQITEIRNLHQTYRLTHFFAYFIRLMSKTELIKMLVKLLDAIIALPYVADMCFTAAVVYRELIDLKIANSIGSFEHLQILHFVKKITTNSDYKNLDEVSKSKCESIAERTPTAFEQILKGSTSNCSLLNRNYDEEPLFCASSNSTGRAGYRNIYSGTLAVDDAYKLWNLSVNSAGVYLMNRSNFSLRYVSGTVMGSAEDFDAQLDYFRLRVMDNDFILLEPTRGILFTIKIYSLRF
jgi:hypothetical protein